MLEIIETNKFQKEMALAERRGKSMEKIRTVINSLSREEPLEKKHRDHRASREWRCCYIELDWFLIYKIEQRTIYLISTGIDPDCFVS